VVDVRGPDGEPEADSDLRRRAAWLLAMLAVVAVLFVVVMSQLGPDDKKSDGNGPRDLDTAVGGPPSSSTTARSTPPVQRTSSSASPPASNGAVRGTKCPTDKTCILDGDPGNGIAAINDYRTQHGRDAVIGRVSKRAQKCAFDNGSGCSGGWAETQLSKLDGPAAVRKILPFAHLLDSFKSFEVGWAYDPRAKQYYFAIIRKD
jgi:hypothetical protein